MVCQFDWFDRCFTFCAVVRENRAGLCSVRCLEQPFGQGWVFGVGWTGFPAARVRMRGAPEARAVRTPWRERRRGRAPRSGPAPTRPRGPATGNGGTARAAGPGHAGQRAGNRPRAGRAPGEAPRGTRAGGAAGEGRRGGKQRPDRVSWRTFIKLLF